LGDHEARELLEAGFLRPTDEFWIEHPNQRQPLAALLEQAPERRTNWLARAKASVTSVGQTAQSRAARVTASLSSLARKQPATAKASVTLVLEGYLPQVRKTVNEKPSTMVGSTRAALQDETFLRKLFGAVYDCLPKPVYRFVNEATFVEFCLRHRRRLLS
jgi:hypothetical protein